MTMSISSIPHFDMIFPRGLLDHFTIIDRSETKRTCSRLNIDDVERHSHSFSCRAGSVLSADVSTVPVDHVLRFIMVKGEGAAIFCFAVFLNSQDNSTLILDQCYHRSMSCIPIPSSLLFITSLMCMLRQLRTSIMWYEV